MVLVMSMGLSSAMADWGVRNVLPTDPPNPDPDPFVRRLQEKTWALEPVLRQRMYLKAMQVRLRLSQELGILKNKYFVHWSPDIYKYDILEEEQFKEATRKGKLLTDVDMTEPSSELPVFVYTDEKARSFVQDELGVYDLVELPEDLIAAIEQIKATPFPKYVERAVSPPPSASFITITPGFTRG